MSETGQSSEGGGAGGFKMENVVNQCLEMNQEKLGDEAGGDMAGKNGTYQLKKKRASMSALYKGK